MISESSDQQRAGLVNLGSLYEAEFTVSLQAGQNVAKFEADNADFVSKAKAAIAFAVANKK